MTIIYIPFNEKEAGDLNLAASLWLKNTTSVETTIVIYHQQDFNEEILATQHEIFICAHGLRGDPELSLFNHSNIRSAQKISMRTLAKRLEQDLLSILPDITTIHLYCCGDAQENAERAHLFQSNLLRAEYSNIHYYSGKVFTPNSEGELLSMNALDETTPIFEVRQTLYHRQVLLDNERIYIKNNTLDSKLSQENRHQDYLKQNRVRRHELFSSRRNNIFNTTELQKTPDESAAVEITFNFLYR